MRGGFGAAALLAALLLTAGQCNLTGGTTQPASGSPETTPTPSPSPTPTAPLTVASVPVHNGEVGLSYAAVTLTATGGSGPYSWSLGGGSLPPGLSLSSDGTISGGTPTAGGFSLTVKVSDAGGSSATAPANITIYPPLKITQQPCVGQCIIGAGCVKCGGFGVVGGGAPPYLYRIVGGAVPPGMRYSGLGVSGPFPAGLYSLTVQVNDSLGAAVTVGANWAIYSPAAISAGTDCTKSGVSGPPSCVATGWKYGGGNPNAAPQVVVLKIGPYCTATGCLPTPAGLPPGWSASAKAGVLSLSANSTLCSTPPYQAVLTIALKDTTACATTLLSAPANLTVNAPNGC